MVPNDNLKYLSVSIIHSVNSKTKKTAQNAYYQSHKHSVEPYFLSHKGEQCGCLNIVTGNSDGC